MSLDLRSQSTLIALAVLIGSTAVAWALYDSNSTALAEDQITIQRASRDDQHLYGSVRAPVTIVEFSDYQCPYCARLHPDLKKIVDSSNGQVAWEYRHLPLSSHPLAQPAAVIAECMADKKGNETFWQYTADIFADQRSMTSNSIKDKAMTLGLSESEIEICKSDVTIDTHIESDVVAAATLGGAGTPFSVIIYPDNSYKVVAGAVPYEQWLNLLGEYVQ